MGKQHDALAVLGLKAAHDVACLEQGAVVGRQLCPLVVHGGPQLLQTGGQIVAAGPVCGRVGHTGSEGHLCGHVAVGAVGIEPWHADGGLFRRRPGVVLMRCLVALVATGHDGEQQRCE